MTCQKLVLIRPDDGQCELESQPTIMSCLDFADGWWWGKGKCRLKMAQREWTEYDEGSVMITTLSLTTHISTFQVSSCDLENRYRMGNCRSKNRSNYVNTAGGSLNTASSNVNRRRLRLGGVGGYGDIGNIDYSNFMSGQVILSLREESWIPLFYEGFKSKKFKTWQTEIDFLDFIFLRFFFTKVHKPCRE